MKYWLCICLILLLAVPVLGQNLFSDTTIIKIELQFSQPDWWDLLVQNKEMDIDIPVHMIVNDTEEYNSVGVRFKGNSSYYGPWDKKPFNINMDEFIDGQDLWGYETFNLNNGFVDPTFVREIIGYDLFKKYMPACQVGFVRLYINGVYWGFYVNVEQVNKDFLGRWFSSREGNMYKGDPHGDLRYLSPWSEPYRSNYEKRTNELEDDWTDLISLVDILNNAPDLETSLPRVLNVDRALWYIAINNILVNLDSYIYSLHNYFIYNSPGSGCFNMIPWDLNEVFGCYPPSVPSQAFFEEYSIFEKEDDYKFPLIGRMLSVPSFRARYLAHYRTLLKSDFHPDTIRAQISYYQSLIDPYVQADNQKLYSYSFFQENVNNPVVVMGGRIVPGIMRLVENRCSYLNQVQDLIRNGPEIQDISMPAGIPRAGETLFFNVTVSGDVDIDGVKLFYKSDVDTFSVISLKDDGMHMDNSAGDGVFGGSFIVPQESSGALLDYYILAQNTEGDMSFYPERAEFECLSVQIQGSSILSDLVINEFMASNTETIADPQGEYDDWIEIYNRSSESISLEGIYLTDDPEDTVHWEFPDTSIAGYGYILVWTDNDDGDRPGLHGNFRIDKSGEYIGLYDTQANGNVMIDAYTFGSQQDDISQGRFPNGEGDFIFMDTPTPGGENVFSTGVDRSETLLPGSIHLYQNYPNPFNSSTWICYNLNSYAEVSLVIYDTQGRLILVLVDEPQVPGEHILSWNGLNTRGLKVATGIYIYQLKVNDVIVRKKMIFVQ